MNGKKMSASARAEKAMPIERDSRQKVDANLVDCALNDCVYLNVRAAASVCTHVLCEV